MNYVLLLIGIILIPVIAQIYVNSTYKKYSNEKFKDDISGFEIARKILDKNKLTDIHIVQSNGHLSDHYDQSRKVIRLSKKIFHGNSIAAIAVAAHETGHAIQDKNKYLFMHIRSFIFPIVRFSSKFAYIIIFLGFITELTRLIEIGIILVSAGVLFQFITLPVEINASKRAKEEIKKLHITRKSDNEKINQMLNAAALTYVAGLVASILELIRLLLFARNRD